MDLKQELKQFTLIKLIQMASIAKRNKQNVYKLYGCEEISFDELMIEIKCRKENGEDTKKEKRDGKIFQKLKKISEFEIYIQNINDMIEKLQKIPLNDVVTQEKKDAAIKRKLKKINEYKKEIQDIIEHNPHIEPYLILKKLNN